MWPKPDPFALTPGADRPIDEEPQRALLDQWGLGEEALKRFSAGDRSAPPPVAGWGGGAGDVADVASNASLDADQNAMLIGKAQMQGGMGTPDLPGFPPRTGESQPGGVGQPVGGLTYADALRQLGIKERTGGGGSSVSTTNAILTPGQGAEFKSRLGESTEAQKGAVGEKSAIAQSMYAQLADNSREQGHGLAAMMKAHEAKTADIEAKVNAQMADNAKMLQEIKATHIDPEGIYNREGGGLLKVRHAIGLALGAFGAALHGGGANPVLAIVNSQLDRDMKAQVANLKTKEYAFQAGRSIVGDLFNQTRDLEKSFVLGKMVYTDIAKMQVDAITKDAQSQEAVQNGAITQAKLDESQVESEMKLKQLEYKRIVRTQTSSAGGLTPGAQMLQKEMVAKFLAGQGGGPAVSKEQEMKNDVTPTSDVSKGLAAVAAMGQLDTLVRMIKKNPLSFFKMDQASRDYMIAAKPAIQNVILAKLGQTSTAPQEKRILDMFPGGLDPSLVGLLGERTQQEQLSKLSAQKKELLAVLRASTPGSTALRDAVKRAGLARDVGIDPDAPPMGPALKLKGMR